MTMQSAELTHDMTLLDYWSGVYSPADRHIDSIRAAYDAFLQHYTLPRTEQVEVEELSIQLDDRELELRVFTPTETAVTETIDIQTAGVRADNRLSMQRDSCTWPWVFYVHGGGNVVGSAESHEFIARQLARDLKSKVFLLEYGLVPECAWGQGLQDCLAVYQQLDRNAQDWQINSDQVVLAADGSGCAIALQLQQQLMHAGTAVQAMALLFPSFDQAVANPVPNAMESLVYQVERQHLIQQWFNLDLHADDYRRVPELTQKLPACFVATATFDPCADANQQLLQQLQHLHQSQRVTELGLYQAKGLRASALPLLRDCPEAAITYMAAVQFLSPFLTHLKNDDE